MASVALAAATRAPINHHRSCAGACRACGGTGDTLLGRHTCETCHGSGYHLRGWDRLRCPQCGGQLEYATRETVPMPCRPCRAGGAA